MFKNFLQQYKDLTVSNKLKFLGVSIAMMAVTLSISFLLIYQYYSEKNLLQNRTETFAKVLADNVAPAILFNDKDQVSTILATLKYRKNLVQVYVMDKHWKVVETYTKKSISSENKQILVSLKSKQFLWEGRDIFSVVPILVESEQIGSLIVVSSLDGYFKRLVKEMLMILIIVLFTIWATLKFTFTLRKEILLPISKLNENINNVLETQNLTNKVPVLNNDEIGKLGKNFNLMLDDLNYTHEQLIEQKDIAEYKAHHDSLTSLPNRVSFNQRLRQIISRSKRNKEHCAIFFMDLDRFKQINDSFGHDVGDEVLQIFAKRIQACIRKEDTLARMSGDEFMLVIENVSLLHSPTQFAHKIIKETQRPLHIAGQLMYMTVSIGISIYPDDGEDTQTLIKNADAAMYKAKVDGKNTFEFYTPEMTEIAYQRILLETELRQALKENEFVVHYQPQMNAVTNELIGMEALIRWDHPQKGLLSPDSFIVLAEETGLIVEIDRWVMQEGMKQITRWHEQGLNPGYLSLNLSIKHLINEDFFTTINQHLEESHCKEEYIHLEITEGEVMKDPERSISLLQEVSDMGISLAIDDFGTGYSSLSHLKRLPIDKLKIDKTFINDIPDDEDAIAIVRTMIALAKTLHLDVVAEGVEDKEQKEFLLEHGCHVIQGYYYSKPLPANEMKEMLIAQKD